MAKNNTPNPTDGRMKDKEVNAISDYLKPNMPLPQYLPYARFLLDTDLTPHRKAALHSAAGPGNAFSKEQLEE